MAPSLSSIKSLMILCLLYVSAIVGDAGLDKKVKTRKDQSLKVQHHKGHSIHGGVHGHFHGWVGKGVDSAVKANAGIHAGGGKGIIGHGIEVHAGLKKGHKKHGKNKRDDEIVPIVGDVGHHGPLPPIQGPPRPAVVAETKFPGAWELVAPNSGVSAMHLQLMPNNKIIMFDATSLGKSAIELPPNNCRRIPQNGDMDCFAHSVEYDPETNKVRSLKVTTDPWCSSGGLAPDGTLVGTGGWFDGEKTIRYFNPCDNCDWREAPGRLADMRWYATQTLLPDGRFVVIGGRRAFNYEFLAPEGQPSPGRIELPFLRETTDLYENNLYPFVHVTPDGNLFILANNKAILLDVIHNKIVRTYPDLPGGARNYPGSACSAILTMDLRVKNNAGYNDMEVLVCGGGDPMAFGKAEKENIFLTALDTCGRIKVMDPNAKWEIEKMPTPRIMSDMLNLPNGDILILNGAKKGASGWQYADEPVFTPLLYSANKPAGQRFKELQPTQIARMYHSSSAVLPDGKILVAGSNTNPSYQFTGVKFPTELRVEKFSPPYLDPQLAHLRPVVDKNTVPKTIGYAAWLDLKIHINPPGTARQEDIMVTMYQPPFTTHGYSMNQRLLSLPISNFAPQAADYTLKVQTPATSSLAPPGHYLLFVNHQGVPSVGSWIQIK